MPILLRCTNCRQKLQVASRKAGTTIECPKCGSGIDVPRPETEAPAAAPKPQDKPSQRKRQPAAAATPANAAQAARRPPRKKPSDEDEVVAIRKAETEFEEMDLTPMVDVTFLLLIFFMITASFTIQQTQPTAPPQPDEQGAQQTIQEEEDLEQDHVMVEVSETDAVTVDDQSVSDLANLQAVIEEKMAGGKNSMVLKRHGSSTHEITVKVQDAANGAGISKIKVAKFGD